MEGPDTSMMTKTWEDLAATEMRLQLMSELGKYSVGLADIEEFNLDLKSNKKIYRVIKCVRNKMQDW